MIFASGTGDLLYTSDCARTQPLDQATQDVYRLDELLPPYPYPQSQPLTVTVQVGGQYPTYADRIFVHFLFAQPQQTDTISKTQEALLIDTLANNRAPAAILSSRTFYGDRTGIYFHADQGQISNNDTEAFLQLLKQTQVDLADDKTLAIGKVEVMFTLQDCLQKVFDAQRQALFSGRGRAELLANALGGRLGAMLSVREEPIFPALTESERLLCNGIRASRWYELPLQVSLEAARALDTNVTLNITYEVKQAVSGTQPLIEKLRNMPSATPSFAVSPLPTPAATATATATSLSFLPTPPPQ